MQRSIEHYTVVERKLWDTLLDYCTVKLTLISLGAHLPRH